MSLQTDLARNRKVFGRLMAGAGIPRETANAQKELESLDLDGSNTPASADLFDLSPARYAVKAPANADLFEPPGYAAKTSRRGDLYEKSTSKPVENYSLEYGIRRQTGMALEFTPPGGPEYPAGREAVTSPAPSLLDELYYQIDVDSRMSSQLLNEEEL